MKNTTPMFPGFHLQTLRRKPRSAQQKLAEKMALLQQKSFKQIGEVFEKFIPCSILKPEQAGAMSRRRLENTRGEHKGTLVYYCINNPSHHFCISSCDKYNSSPRLTARLTEEPSRLIRLPTFAPFCRNFVTARKPKGDILSSSRQEKYLPIINQQVRNIG